MISDYKPRGDQNPCISETGRNLYEKLMGIRKAGLSLAEKVSSCAERETAGADLGRAVVAVEEMPESPSNGGAKFISISTARQQYAGNSVTLGDLLTWYKFREDDAVRGQENALIKITLKAIMLNSFTIEAPAGRGKTYLISALSKTIPEDIAYTAEFVTEAALFNNYQEINSHKILVLPEYQKMLQSSPKIKEVIKTITEGRTASRKKMGDGEDVVEQYITPKCVITAIADENENKEAVNNDKESMRRFSHIRLDTSLQATESVREYQRQKRSTLPEMQKTAPESLGRRVKQHIADCINLQLENPPFDPFSDFMDQYIPMTDKSIAYISDYYSYLDGCAKFHHDKRFLDFCTKKILALDLSDHFIIHTIYHPEFCETLKALDSPEQFEQRVQKAKEPVDWKGCFEAGIAKMKENLPEHVVEKWVSRQLKDNKMIVQNPVTQEEMVLFDYAK
jgi:hypothetical protein